MIDVSFIDRVRWGIGVHDVLKGGVIKGECLTGCSFVQIRVCRGLWSGWITCGSVSVLLVWERVCVMGIESLIWWQVDLVVALCFLSSLMATSLRSL